MPQSVALTADELNALAGPSTLKRFLIRVPPTTVATAQINQVVFDYPLIEIVVDNESGSWSSVRAGQTVWIGTTAGTHDVGIYRVSRPGFDNFLYLEETSAGNPGLLPKDIKTVSLAENQHVTVVKPRNIFSVLPKINYPATDDILEDGYQAVTDVTSTPPPIVNITINGVPGNYGDYITGADTTITAVATPQNWPTSSGSFSFNWVTPSSGWSDITGPTTDTLEATVEPGNYWLGLVVTDGGGHTTYAERFVGICDPTINPPIPIAEVPRSDERDRTGRRMTFSLYNDALADIEDGVPLLYVEKGSWNGTDVPTATRHFFGWLLRQTSRSTPGLRDAEVELVGPAGLMALLDGTSDLITSVASPLTWQEAVPGLMSATFMAWLILYKRAANLLTMFNFTAHSYAASGQRIPEWRIDKSTILEQIQSLVGPRGNFGCNSHGEMFFLHHPSMIDYGSRGSIPVRATLTSARWQEFNAERRLYNQVRQIRGEGFSWDGSATEPTTLLSDAPESPGQGGAPQKLDRQVVDDQDTLNQITGDYYALVNNPYNPVDIFLPKNYDCFEPAEMYFVEGERTAAESPDGEAFSKNIVLSSVSKIHNQDGTADMRLRGEVETHGLTGVDVPVPVGNTNLFTDNTVPSLDLPPTPPMDYNPDIMPDVVRVPGSVDVRSGYGGCGNSSTKVGRWYDMLSSNTLDDEDVTPSGVTNVVMVTMDASTSTSRAAYALTNDGADTRVFYTPDIFAPVVSWSGGETISGLYTDMRVYANKVMVYNKSTSAPIFIETLTIANDGTPSTTGFTSSALSTYRFKTLGDLMDLNTSLNLPHDGVYSSGLFSNPDFVYYSGFGLAIDDGGGYDRWPNPGPYPGTHIHEWDIPGTGSAFNIKLQDSPYNDNDGTLRVSVYEVETAAGVKVSFDYGGSFSSTIGVGDVPAVGGIDLNRLGTVSLAIAAEQVKIAATFGADYSNAPGGASGSVDPVSVLILWYLLDSISTSNNGASPDYIYATDALDGGEALFKVHAGVRTPITPSVTGTKALGYTRYGLSSWKGKRILYLGKISATEYLHATANTGTSWTSTSMAGATSVRCRRFSPNGLQWLVTLASTTLKYTADGGLTFTNKTSAAGIAYRYAEFFK